MDTTKEEMVLMRSITWMGEDAVDGCEEAKEIIEGLKGLVKIISTHCPTCKKHNNPFCSNFWHVERNNIY